MKKYFEVFRLSFKMQITWRFDLAMTVVSTSGRLIAAWILWSAIFGSAGLVGGFTFESMLSYYIVGSVLATIDFSYQISGEITYLIRGGRFSGHMAVPMDPLLFFGSMAAGESAFHLGFSILSVTVCTLFFGTGIVLTGDILKLAVSVVMIPLGLSFMAAYHYIIGVLTFRFLDIDFFLHVQGMIISFATGALIPLSMLPERVLLVLNLLPFTHVVYTPAMLITGRLSAAEGLAGLCVILIWVAAASVAARFIYTKMRTLYDGVGI
jgi:ABC-2 type transport system permease protein